MALSYQSILLLILLAVDFTACRVVAAADDLSSDEAAETFAWAKEAFAKINCGSAGKSAKPFDAHDRSLLRWSNPAVGQVYGDVFLWTRDNRPAALVSLYEWHSPYTDRTAEFSSLSNEPLTATVGKQTLWRAGSADLRWKALEPSPAPGRNAKTRLIQMRGLVARFRVVLDDRRNDDRGEPQRLRKLSRPVFRYDDADTGLLDGALFAFVKGTDPEAFLLVEAKENSEAKAAWHYALARMNTDPLSVKLDNKVVQEFPDVRKQLFDRTRSYCVSRWPKERQSTVSVPEEQK